MQSKKLSVFINSIHLNFHSITNSHNSLITLLIHQSELKTFLSFKHTLIIFCHSSRRINHYSIKLKYQSKDSWRKAIHWKTQILMKMQKIINLSMLAWWLILITELKILKINNLKFITTIINLLIPKFRKGSGIRRFKQRILLIKKKVKSQNGFERMLNWQTFAYVNCQIICQV